MRSHEIVELEGENRRLFYARMSRNIEYDLMRVIKRFYKCIFTHKTMVDFFEQYGYGVDFREDDYLLLTFININIIKFGESYKIFFNEDINSKKFIYIRKCHICHNFDGNLERKMVHGKEMYHCINCKDDFNETFDFCVNCKMYMPKTIVYWYHARKLCVHCVVSSIVESCKQLFNENIGGVLYEVIVSDVVFNGLVSFDNGGIIPNMIDNGVNGVFDILKNDGIIVERQRNGYLFSKFDLNGLIERILMNMPLKSSDKIRNGLIRYADYILHKIEGINNDNANVIRELINGQQTVLITPTFSILL